MKWTLWGVLVVLAGCPSAVPDSETGVTGLTIQWEGGVSDVVVMPLGMNIEDVDDQLWAIQCMEDHTYEDGSAIPQNCLNGPIEYGNAGDAFEFMAAPDLEEGVEYSVFLGWWEDVESDEPIFASEGPIPLIP